MAAQSIRVQPTKQSAYVGALKGLNIAETSEAGFL